MALCLHIFALYLIIRNVYSIDVLYFDQTVLVFRQGGKVFKEVDGKQLDRIYVSFFTILTTSSLQGIETSL